MIAGTRMAPCGSIRQVVESTCVNCEGSIDRSPSHVDDAGRRPYTIGIFGDLERRVSCSLWLTGRGMSCDVNWFSPQRSCEVAINIDPHNEAAKHHLPHCHLIDHGIKPFDEQNLEIG